jgi:hypothetical protein
MPGPAASASAMLRCSATRSAKGSGPVSRGGSRTSATHAAHAVAAALSPSLRVAAQSARMRGVGKATLPRNVPSSNSRAKRRCGPRSAPVWQSGWDRIATSASASSGPASASAARRRNRPEAVRPRGSPPLSSGTMPQRSSAAATCRVSVRSGLTRAARTPRSAASRRPSAMAVASVCGFGASRSVTEPSASSSPSRRGPSSRHWSVTGAGRSASDTTRFRAAFGGAIVGSHSGMSQGSMPAASATRARRYCG